MHNFFCCTLFIAGTDGDQNGLDHPSVEVSLDENSGMLVDGFERTFDGKLKCRYCNYASKGTARLIEHIRIHTGNGKIAGKSISVRVGEGPRGAGWFVIEIVLIFKNEGLRKVRINGKVTPFLQSNNITTYKQVRSEALCRSSPSLAMFPS